MDDLGPVKNTRVFMGKGHSLVTRAFSSYGGLAARRPYLLMMIGFVVLGGLMFGLFRAERENRVEFLFVNRHSAVAHNRDYYNSKYGGFSRKEVFAVSDPANKAAYSSTNLAALLAASAPIYMEDESAFNGSVLNPTQTTMTATIKGNSQKLTEANFCERPQVQTVFKPSVPGVPYFLQGNFLSVGYQFLTTCLPTKSAPGSPLNGLPLATLPPGWGIDRYPCTKVSPLDCFQEGGFDYPGTLRLLEQPGAGPLPLALVDIVYAHPAKEECIADFGAKIVADTTPFIGAAAANVTATQIIEALNSTTALFSSWGYRWRPSFKTMTDQQILAHFNAAYANGLATLPVQECILNKQSCCLGWEATHVPMMSAFGGVAQDATGAFTQIESIRIVTNNFNPDHPEWVDQVNAKFATGTSSKDRHNLVKDWDARMTDTWKPMYERKAGSGFAKGEPYNASRAGFTTWTAVENVLKDAGALEPSIVVPAVVLIIAYVILATINVFQPVHSHVHLGLLGLLSVTLSIIAGVAVTAIFGVKLSPLNLSIALLLALGIGINDMFVFGKSFKNFVRQRADRAFEDEMRLAVGLAGPSVCLTMLSIFVAFGIAAATPIPAVSWFCIQLCVTVFLQLFALFFIFVPFMGIDARRAKAGKIDPFLRTIPLHRLVRNRNSAPEPAASTGSDLEAAKGALAKPPKAEIDAGGWMPRLVRRFYAPLFDSKIFAIFVVAFAIAFFVAMAVLAFTQSENDLPLTDITRRGTFQHDYARLTTDVFDSWDMVYVNHDIDFPNQQANILATYGQLQASPWVEKSWKILESAWLAASPKSVLFNANQAGLVATPLTPLPAPLFYPYFRQYMPVGGQSILQYYHCKNTTTNLRVDCSKADATTVIDATADPIFVNGLTSTNKYLHALNDLNAVVNTRNQQSGSNSFIYGYPSVLYNQFNHIERHTFFIVGLTLVGVFVTSLLFQWSLLLSFLVTVLLLVIAIELYAFLWIMTGKLNALSMVNLAVAVGLATEYTFHLSRNFLVFEGTRHQRVAKALEWTLEPLLHGMAAFFLAILPLAFAKYRAFVLYYFAMFTMLLVIAAFNGFMLLPVILRYVGPPSIFRSTASDERSASTRADSFDKPGQVEMGPGRRPSVPDEEMER